MRTFDLTPLFRTTVGFDRLNQMLDSALRLEEVPSYPPYNIERLDEDSYRISMAVAGFSTDDLDITAQDGQLIVTGRIEDRDEEKDEDRTFLHRGIASRAFERRFQLADHIKVAGADLVNGLLHIDLVREVPEALKPRKIEIASGKSSKRKVIENKTAKAA